MARHADETRAALATHAEQTSAALAKQANETRRALADVTKRFDDKFDRNTEAILALHRSVHSLQMWMIGLLMGLIGVYGAANIVRWIFSGLAIQFPPQTRNPAHRSLEAVIASLR